MHRLFAFQVECNLLIELRTSFNQHGKGMRQGRAISFKGSVSPVALILIFENIALKKQLCLYSRARRPAKPPKIFEGLMGRNVSRKKRFRPFATRVLDQTRQSRTFANRMKNTKPDSVFAKSGSSFAFECKGQFRSISLNRTRPEKTNTGSLAEGIKVHSKPILFNVNVPNFDDRLNGVPVFVPNRGIDGSNDFGLATYDLAQKTRMGFEYASKFVGCEREYAKIRHTLDVKTENLYNFDVYL